jgi:hypothetical protein
MHSIAYAALWIYVFSVPWGSVISIGSGVNLIGRVTGMVALGLALLAATVSGRIRRLHGFHVAAFLFVMWAGVTQLLFFQGGDRLSSKFWTYVQLLLVLWIMWELAASVRSQRGLLMAYVLGAYVVAAQTILLSRSEAGLMRRFAAGGADPNGVAMTLALALPMAWHLGLTLRHPILRWGCRAYLPIGVVALGLTGSRGGMLATVVALLIVPLSMTKLTPARLATAITLLGLSGALAVAYVPDKIVQRLATTGTEVQDLKLGGRFSIWVAGVHAFTQKPIMGYGTGGFKTAVRPWGIEQVAHNSFLSVLVEQGIVGLLLYLSMLLAVFLAVIRLPRLERRFGLVLLCTLVVAIVPLTWEDNKAVWFVMAALLGLARAQTGVTSGPVQQPLAGRPAPLARRSTSPAAWSP